MGTGGVNLFNTGKSALFASRSSLATTGHNVSNVNTEGYSRQRVEQTSNTPVAAGAVTIGTGTRVTNVHRINDEYITRQIGNEMKRIGEYEEKDIALAQAETIFNEIDNDGMNRLMAKFFNDWRKLGNEPESEALRSVLRESTNQLTGDFHRIARSVKDIQKNIDARLEMNVRQANEYVGRIAKLNEEIKRAESRGGEAPDLRDQRDLTVKKLSTICDVNLATNEKGEITVSLNGAGPLVSGVLSNKIYLQTNKADPETGRPEGGMKVYLEGRSPPDITDRLKTGRLAGLIEARDQILGRAMRKVDELAYTVATKVNEIHRQGFTIGGATGLNFFKQPDQIERAAELMSISDTLAADANNIATAVVPDAPGDNRLVQYISRIQHGKIMGGGASTLDDYYNGTVAELATSSQKNKHVFEHQGHIVSQLEKIRESISGVSLDEETTNLVQFQHAFDAAAKVIKVADEILETVLNLKR